MIKISKKFIQISQAIFLGVVLSVGASYVQALTARPGDINENAPNVIDVGDIDQTKGDTSYPLGGQISVKSLIAGFVTQGTDSSPVDYTRINDLGYMSVGRFAPGTGIVLDVKGKTNGVKGTIRALRLAHTVDVKVPVCVSPTGLFSLCGESLEYNTVKNSQNVDESGIYSLIVPPGVSSIQVTLRGAGGAGYGDKNIETYKDDGDASFFAGENVYLFANGGRGAESSSSFGVGGEATSSGSSISSVSKYNGGSGENPPSFTGNPSVIITGPCNSTNFYLVKGGSGNTGGKGGAPYQGSQASGGIGANGGPTAGTAWNFTNGSGESMGTYINCIEVYNTSDTHQSGSEENNRIGGSGVDGALGAGGSGFGGQGGASALADAPDCSNFSDIFICKGGVSVAGGGAGAYINATINVNQGEIFYIKAGRGGIPQYSTCSGDIMACKKSKIGGGAISGKGGHGQVLVQFNYF